MLSFDDDDVPKNQTRVVHWRKSEYDVYIGRPSKWGNPFKCKNKSNKEERAKVIQQYREYILTQPYLLESLHELKDKRLGCWCYPKPCHGEVLAELIQLLYYE